jgi:Leucine-rich repeat (LRR) protein
LAPKRRVLHLLLSISYIYRVLHLLLSPSYIYRVLHLLLSPSYIYRVLHLLLSPSYEMSASTASASQNQDKFAVKTLRISVIGEQGCGKSTFVEQFVTGKSRLSKSSITFELERTLISRIIKREYTASSASGAPKVADVVTKYDLHVHDACASPVTNGMALETASCADFVIICFSMLGDNISVLFRIILDLFKVCHAASRPRPPFMLVGLRKSWDKLQISKELSQKDSKATSSKQSENLSAIVHRIIDMFQCKLNFVVLCDNPESDASASSSSSSAKPTAAIQNSASAGPAPPEVSTALEVFSRAVDEYELSRDHVRAFVCDSSAYRIYYNPQHHRLACMLKKDWTKDLHIDMFLFPDFVAISVSSCNLLDMPPKIFDVVQLQCLDVSDNPLAKLNDSFSTLSVLTVLNASNTKLSVEPSVLAACTTLTDLNLSRNCLLNASCLLKCASLIRLDISENVGCVVIDATGVDVKLGSLCHLNLSKTTCASLDFIGLLTGITHLNLRETGIRDATLCFLSQLKNLRHLDVSCNKLSDIAIPAHLEIVLVDNNQLKSFEISCLTSGPHNLTKLSIKNNQLTELPKQIWHVSSLQELSFAGNSVSMLDFSFAFCGKRLVKFECDGNPFNLMPPAISDLLANNKFSEACEMSIKSLPLHKIAVLSKSNSPAFDCITKQLSRVCMIVSVQEKSSVSSKPQWAKALLVATMNPARVYFLSPDDSSDASALEARMKDKPFWDISNPTFKFIHESGGARQFLGTISMGSKSGTAVAAGKSDLTVSSKTIDFFSASNRHQWDQYFKATAKFQPKSDRQRIFFKSMPGFFPRASVSADAQFSCDIDPASPNISPLLYAAAPRFDSMGLTSDSEVSQTNSQSADLAHVVSTQASAAAAVVTPSVAEIANAEKISSLLEQQVSCKYNSIFLSAPVNDMNYFLPFLANSDILVVNMAGDAFAQSELSAILSGIKFVSRQCLKHVFVVVEAGQATSFMDALGQRDDDAFKVICYHPSGSEDLTDQIHEAMKSLSFQRAMEPFVEYFQSFIMGVIRNRPPWTDSKTMMISFSELLDCIFTRRNSFDALGKCCLSFLEDASYDVQKYVLQTCQLLDNCGVLLCWNSHTRDPVIICNLDLFVQDAMIPLLCASRNRKQVLTDSRVQSSSSSRVILTPQDRAHIWSALPAVTSSVMGDLDWALLSLHVAAIALDEMPADGALSLPQSSPENMQDRPPNTAAASTNKKEGWIYCEDSLSRAVKRHWFTCSAGSDGVYALTWRNSESAYTTTTSQSISFGKSTKTTVSQTKRNRQGWSHCCRVDHEDSRVSAKKLHSTKIVMCFNNEKEMREWWSFIESSAVPRMSSVISAPESMIKSSSTELQLLNLTLALEDEPVSKNMITLSSIFEDIDFGSASASDTVSSGERTADSAVSASTWLVFVVRIDAVSEYILRSVACAMSLYTPNIACGRCDHAVKAIFKRGAAAPPCDPVTVRRDCCTASTAVLSFMQHSTFTEVTVISAGHECHVLADILLEALIRSTTCGVAQCAVFPAEDVARTAETYALPERCCRAHSPALFPSCSFASTISRTVVPNLRRIVHIHSSSLTHDSRVIQEWASSNHWEYAAYTCSRTDCIRAAEKASASERVVLILESSFVVHRGRLVAIALALKFCF